MTREEAINILHGMRADNLNLDDLYTKDKYDALEMAIQALEQEPKTGHWIKSKDGYMRCDKCGSRGSAIKARFCHHCGARMVEPQESEEISREEIAALLASGSEEMTREQAKGNLIHSIRWNDMPKKESLDMAIEALDFAKWVATEIFDENWEYNKDAFTELACRKLAKLGIVRAKGNEWELVDPQENCDTCKHKEESWDSEHCDGCCGNYSGFEPQESEDKE